MYQCLNFENLLLLILFVDLQDTLKEATEACMMIRNGVDQEGQAINKPKRNNRFAH
jgi:hypothetical protein